MDEKISGGDATEVSFKMIIIPELLSTDTVGTVSTKFRVTRLQFTTSTVDTTLLIVMVVPVHESVLRSDR
jgi:hypothetical protein